MNRNKLFHLLAAIVSTTFVLIAIGSRSIESISFAKTRDVKVKPRIEQTRVEIATETIEPKKEIIEEVISYDTNITWNKKQLPKSTLSRFKKPKHLGGNLVPDTGYIPEGGKP